MYRYGIEQKTSPTETLTANFTGLGMRDGIIAAADSPLVTNVIEMPIRQSVIDAEFSEAGRDPRFLPGWFILPTAFAGLAFVGIGAASIIYWLL